VITVLCIYFAFNCIWSKCSQFFNPRSFEHNSQNLVPSCIKFQFCMCISINDVNFIIVQKTACLSELNNRTASDATVTFASRRVSHVVISDCSKLKNVVLYNGMMFIASFREMWSTGSRFTMKQTRARTCTHRAVW
jgi:hypothetical protein